MKTIKKRDDSTGVGINMINQNKMARHITLQEGGKENLSIAQVKEVQKLVLEYLADEKPSDVLKLLEKHEH